MLSENKRNYLVNRIVDKLTLFLINDYNLSLPKAMETVYNSKVYSLLEDESTELLAESPAYVYEKMKMEFSDNAGAGFRTPA